MLVRVADVELRHLATMAAIADAGTFGRAGSRLGYPQSSISQQIAALEKSVGGPARTPRLRPAPTRGIYPLAGQIFPVPTGRAGDRDRGRGCRRDFGRPGQAVMTCCPNPPNFS
jgi:hypothetical protein